MGESFEDELGGRKRGDGKKKWGVAFRMRVVFEMMKVFFFCRCKLWRFSGKTQPKATLLMKKSRSTFFIPS